MGKANTNSSPELFSNEDITPQEWAWVQDLIQDVQRQELCETFAKSLFEWDLVVRQFRKVEYKRIVIGSPTENDWLCHSVCLYALLAFGKLILLQSRKISDAELKALGVTRDEIVAYVEELEQSSRERHHGITEAELSTVREAIFGGAT